MAGSAASGPINDDVFTIKSRPRRTVRPKASSGNVSGSGTVHAGAGAGGKLCARPLVDSSAASAMTDMILIIKDR
jgi:hypothetical protein